MILNTVMIANLKNISHIIVYKKKVNDLFSTKRIRRRKYWLFGEKYETTIWLLDNKIKLYRQEVLQLLGDDCEMEYDTVYYKPRVEIYFNSGDKTTLYFMDDEDAKEYVDNLIDEMKKEKYPIKRNLIYGKMRRS